VTTFSHADVVAAAESGPSVFESAPKESTTHAGAGKADVESGSEYETDDEEEA